jgi:hypothetical protein
MSNDHAYFMRRAAQERSAAANAAANAAAGKAREAHQLMAERYRGLAEADESGPAV